MTCPQAPCTGEPVGINDATVTHGPGSGQPILHGPAQPCSPSPRAIRIPLRAGLRGRYPAGLFRPGIGVLP